MRLYLAGSALQHDTVHGVARRLRDRGHLVVSSWHGTMDTDLETRTSDELLTHRPELYRDAVQSAMAEIRSADAIVVFTGGPSRGGRHFEFGYAVAMGLHTIIVGPREHLFHTLVCEAYSTLDEWLATMPDDRAEVTFPDNVRRLHGRA